MARTAFSLLLEGWKRIGEAMGHVMSFVFVTIFWAVILGIYAVILKIIGFFRTPKPSDSFWIDVTHATKSTYHDQF